MTTLLVSLAALSVPSPVLGDGTGDLPDPPPDVLTPGEASRKRALETRRTEPVSGDVEAASSGVTASYYMEPGHYRVIWTPTHAQERPYWCGPATVQVIDDYFGPYASQSVIAAWLGTTQQGTAFTRVDDALRHFTGKQYFYYGGLSETALWGHVAYSLRDRGQPLAIDVRILGSLWPYYNFDYAGHITVLDGFDWRHGTVKLNDVYSERWWRVGGGDTLGHKTYPRWVIWDGIRRHPQRAVVAAP